MRALAGCFLVLSFLLPFVLFGGRTWSSLVLASAAFSAAAAGLAAWSAGARFQRGVLLLAAVPVLLGTAQLLPLPHGLVEALSPVRARVQATIPVEDLEGWSEAATRTLSLSELMKEGGEAPVERQRVPEAYALSFDPAGTGVALLALAAALLLLASLAGQPDERLGLGALAVCLACVAAGAVYGLWHARAGGPLYGVFAPPPFDHHRPYGTFWNLNHFAGLCALGCPVLLAAALDGARKIWLRLAALVLLAPCAAAVLDAGSRGGLLAGGAGALLLAAFLARSPGRRGMGLALGGLALVAMLLAFTVFSERLIQESLDETTALDQDSNRQRMELYRRQLGMIARAPIAGHGLGAFHDAHGPYKETPLSLVPHHGESDWVETAVESGVLGWLAWLGLAILLWLPGLRLAWGGRAPPLLTGLLAGSMATVAHAAVDFHHREPAVAVVSLLLAGTAHAWSRRLLAGDSDEARDPSPPTRGHRVLAFACVGLALIAMVFVRDALHFDLGREGALRALELGQVEKALAAAIEARDARPSDGQGWALEAAARQQLAHGLRGEARREQLGAALAASARALRCSPATLGAARRAGSLLLSVGATAEARRAAELAVVVAPGHSPSRQLLGEVLLIEERDAEALGHLAFAYEGIPLARLSEQAPRFARLLDEASHGVPKAFLAAVTSTEHRAWFLSALARSGRAAELPVYFELLRKEPLPERARSFVGLLVHAPGPEAADFTRYLLPALEDPWSRSLAGRALVEGGAVDEGAELLAGLLDEADAPAGAWLALADARIRQGRSSEALEVLDQGLSRHPQDRALSRRRESLAPN